MTAPPCTKEGLFVHGVAKIEGPCTREGQSVHGVGNLRRPSRPSRPTPINQPNNHEYEKFYYLCMFKQNLNLSRKWDFYMQDWPSMTFRRR